MIPEWQARLIEETLDLRQKYHKLHEFMATKEFYMLDRERKDLLYAQSHAMLTYLQLLGKRLEAENLKLPAEEYL